MNAFVARLRAVLAAWRSITRREILATFALGVALFVYHIPAGLVDPEEAFTSALIFVADQIKVFPILLGYVAVDRLTDRDADRRLAYVIAACAGALVSAPLAVTWTSLMIDRFLHPAHPRLTFMVYIGLETAVLGSAVLWIIADRARARRARERMHKAELDRIEAERRSVESELQAMQARVEPGFLFGTLAQVKRLYERDPLLGERMMDELIAYLHAAMPRMRDTSSTLAQEFDLARAYLAIVNVRLDDRLRLRIDCPSGADDVRMPPMMLLPLIDHAMRDAVAPAGADRSLGLSAEIGATAIRVSIRDSGDGYRRAGESIAGIRERLSALYAAGTALALRGLDPAGSEAILELPVEAIPANAPAG